MSGAASRLKATTAAAAAKRSPPLQRSASRGAARTATTVSTWPTSWRTKPCLIAIRQRAATTSSDPTLVARGCARVAHAVAPSTVAIIAAAAIQSHSTAPASVPIAAE